MSRPPRSVFALLACLLATALLAPRAALAQAPVARAPAPATQNLPVIVFLLKDGVYWSRGFSNNGFIVGKRGVIALDTRLAVEQERALLDQLRQITPEPITHVILTHGDGDHVNGLVLMPPGVTVIGSTYTKQLMQQHLAHGGGFPSPAGLDRYLPNQLVDSHYSGMLDGVPIRLYHWAPAHTAGDLVLYLPEQRIAFTGDLVISEIPDPFIHPDEGGSILGELQDLKQLIALNADIYVPGHGDLVTRAELQRRLARYEAIRVRVQQLLRQGASLPDVRRALNEPAASGDARGARPTIVDYLYRDLSAQTRSEGRP